MKPTSLLFLAVCTCIIPSHAAELKLARVFSQNTVLQRDRAVLDPLPANAAPASLLVSAPPAQPVTIAGVVIGDVFL